MSPEQARGQAVDARTDVWAFGCVLYELIVGRLAFGGATVSDTIVNVLERDPDWRALPPSTPPSIRRLLGRCLEKDPKAPAARDRGCEFRSPGRTRRERASAPDGRPDAHARRMGHRSHSGRAGVGSCGLASVVHAEREPSVSARHAADLLSRNRGVADTFAGWPAGRVFMGRR